MEKEHEISRSSGRFPCRLAPWLILGASLCIYGRAGAQPLSLRAPAARPGAAEVRPEPVHTLRLPETVRRNPSGYSPLCRLELKLENTLPVSVWAELPPGQAAPRAGAVAVPHMQLKLLRF